LNLKLDLNKELSFECSRLIHYTRFNNIIKKLRGGCNALTLREGASRKFSV
jgi:hypothetical protein